MTENTGQMEVGEGVLWRSHVEPTSFDRNINQAAIPLLTTPRRTLVNDVPPSERTSREVMLWAANSYFDALEGDDGKIAALADDCVRHENGWTIGPGR
ncbi:MAG TPA: hypothetical protein VMH80_00925 [Bryobacteraceae bacterium]|nr:hypothetical protein [Bryobacteraceae bacterium]